MLFKTFKNNRDQQMLRATCFLSFPLIACSTCLAIEPGFTLIEPPPGLTGTTVSDISADGKFVVGRSFASPVIRGFIWSNGVREDLVHPESYDTSGVYHISDDGQTMVAYFGRFTAPYNDFWYLGSSSGPYFNSWPVPRDSPNHVIYGMSGDGSTVYGRWGRHSTTDTNPEGLFTWRGPNTEVQMLPVEVPIFDFPTIDAGTVTPNSMTYSGDILVGTAWNELSHSAPVLWRNNLISRIPFSPSELETELYAVAISSDGQYVGGSISYWGVIWRDLEVVELIEPLPPYGSSFFITFIADHGRLALDELGGIWTKELGLLPSSTFLAMHGAPVPAGWSSIRIKSASSDGSIFAGEIRNQTLGLTRGFIAHTTYKPCYADFNSDGGVDGQDVESFFTIWESGESPADVNLDGGVTGDDVGEFFTQWSDSCGPS